MAGTNKRTSKENSNLSGVSSETLSSDLDISLVKFSMMAVIAIMVSVWFQYANPIDTINTKADYYSINAFSHSLEELSGVLQENSTYPIKLLTKDCTGSSDDPVRFNPEIKKVAMINESKVITEVLDVSIHPRDYTTTTTTTKSSGLILREAVVHSSGAFLSSPLNKSVEEVVRTKVPITHSAEPVVKKEVLPTPPKRINTKPIIPESRMIIVSKPKSEIPTLTLSTLKLSSVAVRIVEAPVFSDNASITKNENESYNEAVDETEVFTSVSLTQDAMLDELTVEDEIGTTATETDELQEDYEITSSSFLEMKEAASVTDKMLMVRFTASWCIPCKMMEDNVYSNPEVKEYMDEHFLSLKLDSDSFDGINLKQKYEVKLIPTVLVFKSDGELAGQYEKAMSSDKMLSILKDLNAKHYTGAADSLAAQFENDPQIIESIITPIAK